MTKKKGILGIEMCWYKRTQKNRLSTCWKGVTYNLSSQNFGFSYKFQYNLNYETFDINGIIYLSLSDPTIGLNKLVLILLWKRVFKLYLI